MSQASIDQPRARLNPHNPNAGRFKKTHVAPDGRRYVAGQWYPVSLSQAKYLATVRQRSNDVHSQFAFLIARNMASAVAIEDAEVAAKKRIVNRAIGTDAMSANDMRDFLKKNEGGRPRSDDDNIFAEPQDAETAYIEAVETLFVTNAEKASRKGIQIPGAKQVATSQRKRRRGKRGGRNRNRNRRGDPSRVMSADEMRAHVNGQLPPKSAKSEVDKVEPPLVNPDRKVEGVDDPDGLLIGRKTLQVDEADGRVLATDKAGKSTAAEFDKEWGGGDED